MNFSLIKFQIFEEVEFLEKVEDKWFDWAIVHLLGKNIAMGKLGKGNEIINFYPHTLMLL